MEAQPRISFDNTEYAFAYKSDKELKKVLHLAALSTIRLKNDMAAYFNRKVNEGKNKMSVLNAVRNKIIHRICAVLKNKSVYENCLVVS